MDIHQSCQVAAESLMKLPGNILTRVDYVTVIGQYADIAGRNYELRFMAMDADRFLASIDLPVAQYLPFSNEVAGLFDLVNGRLSGSLYLMYVGYRGKLTLMIDSQLIPTDAVLKTAAGLSLVGQWVFQLLQLLCEGQATLLDTRDRMVEVINSYPTTD